MLHLPRHSMAALLPRSSQTTAVAAVQATRYQLAGAEREKWPIVNLLPPGAAYLVASAVAPTATASGRAEERARGAEGVVSAPSPQSAAGVVVEVPSARALPGTAASRTATCRRSARRGARPAREPAAEVASASNPATEVSSARRASSVPLPPRRPRGFAFVTFSAPQEAQAAIAALDGSDVAGRSLRVNVSEPQSRGGGGGGY